MWGDSSPLLYQTDSLSITHNHIEVILADSRRGLEISYNMLNLPSEVHKTDSTDSARFIYLSDGTKLKTIEGDGHTVPGPLAHGSAWDDLHRRHFGGKEEVGDGGLDLLDFGARYYDPYSFSWTSVDPMGDLFPAKSPYQYCNANPVRFVDPSGKSSYTFNGQRYVVDDGDNATSGNSEEQFLRKISARTNNYALEDDGPKDVSEDSSSEYKSSEWIKKGLITTAGGIGSAIGGGIAVGASCGTLAGMGALALVEGLGQIGIGIAITIVGLMGDPVAGAAGSAEAVPTNALNAIGKAIDTNEGNESGLYESIANVVSSVVGLSTISKAKGGIEALSNTMSILQFVNAGYGLYNSVSSGAGNTSQKDNYDNDNINWKEQLNHHLIWTP